MGLCPVPTIFARGWRALGTQVSPGESHGVESRGSCSVCPGSGPQHQPPRLCSETPDEVQTERTDHAAQSCPRAWLGSRQGRGEHACGSRRVPQRLQTLPELRNACADVRVGGTRPCEAQWSGALEACEPQATGVAPEWREDRGPGGDGAGEAGEPASVAATGTRGWTPSACTRPRSGQKLTSPSRQASLLPPETVTLAGRSPGHPSPCSQRRGRRPEGLCVSVLSASGGASCSAPPGKALRPPAVARDAEVASGPRLCGHAGAQAQRSRPSVGTASFPRLVRREGDRERGVPGLHGVVFSSLLKSPPSLIPGAPRQPRLVESVP